MKKPDKHNNFFSNVYDVVQLIPTGRVTTYGAIATYLGSKGSARMVGWALNSAVGTPQIPAHRVVNRMGRLSGKSHFGKANTMQSLLEQEGHQIVDNELINFNLKFWDPTVELQP